MQEVLDNTLTLLSILTLGVLATALGPRLVFIVAPPLIVLVVVGLNRTGFRITAQDPPQTRVILQALLGTSTAEQSQP